MSQYATYQVSTLEKSCIWQPHYGPELGLKLELADQESVLPSDVSNGKNVIDANEIRYLSESRVRANKRHYDEQPWWLRHTTSNLSTDITVKDLTRMKKSEVTITDEVVNIFDPKEIEKSFIDVEKKVRSLSLPSKRAKTNNDGIASTSSVEWAIPLLPDENNSNDIFSLLKFDENPTLLIDNNSSNSNKQIGQRIEKCIITNYRPTEKRGAFISSLIVPSDSDNNNTDSNSTKYTHVSDFHMTVKKKETGMSDFMIVINNDSNNVPVVASFTPLGAFVDMKKTAQKAKVKNEDGVIVERVHDFYVRRR